MEAKDTILDYDQLRKICVGKDITICDATNAAKAQAEISFKAGYEEGMKSQGTPRTDLECELADEEFRKEFHIARKDTNMELYKAGIREVMEWIYNFTENNAVAPNFYDEWQTKLKKWGIE